MVKKPEPWSQAQDETHLCCTPDLFLWVRAWLPKVGGALQKYLVGIGAPVCSNRGEKRASCKDHNQRWPQSKMTTTKDDHKKEPNLWSGGDWRQSHLCSKLWSRWLELRSRTSSKVGIAGTESQGRMQKIQTLSEAMTLIVSFLLLQTVLLRYMCRY